MTIRRPQPLMRVTGREAKAYGGVKVTLECGHVRMERPGIASREPGYRRCSSCAKAERRDRD